MAWRPAVHRARSPSSKNARRDAVSLWLLKWQLWKAGQEKFYKTSREFKAIDRLCWWVPNTVTR